MSHRNNEEPKLWFRTERIFSANGQWYFHTREGLDVGPYATEFEACIESDLLKNQLLNVPDQRIPQTIRDFVFESAGCNEHSLHLGAGVYTDYVVRESATNLTISRLLGTRD